VSDIFREIDEELRRENLLKLWSRYGKYVIGVVVLVLVVAGAIAAWRSHEASERRAQSGRYSAALALVREGKTADASRLFATLAQEGGGYALLASFAEAELIAKNGDQKAAIAAYDRLAASSGIDREFRDLQCCCRSAWVTRRRSEGCDRTPAAIDRERRSVARQRALELSAAAKLKAGRPQRCARNLQIPGRRSVRAATAAGASRRDGGCSGCSRRSVRHFRAMNRREFAVLLLSLTPAGCDWFSDKKQPLPGSGSRCLGLLIRRSIPIHSSSACR
jgi:hypothetical protein